MRSWQVTTVRPGRDQGGLDGVEDAARRQPSRGALADRRRPGVGEPVQRPARPRHPADREARRRPLAAAHQEGGALVRRPRRQGRRSSPGRRCRCPGPRVRPTSGVASSRAGAGIRPGSLLRRRTRLSFPRVNAETTVQFWLVALELLALLALPRLPDRPPRRGGGPAARLVVPAPLVGLSVVYLLSWCWLRATGTRARRRRARHRGRRRRWRGSRCAVDLGRRRPPSARSPAPPSCPSSRVVAVAVLFTFHFSSVFRLDHLSSAAGSNIDVAAYSLVAGHLVDDGLSGPGNIYGYDLSERAEDDAFGATALVAIGGRRERPRDLGGRHRRPLRGHRRARALAGRAHPAALARRRAGRRGRGARWAWRTSSSSTSRCSSSSSQILAVALLGGAPGGAAGGARRELVAGGRRERRRRRRWPARR